MIGPDEYPYVTKRAQTWSTETDDISSAEMRRGRLDVGRRLASRNLTRAYLVLADGEPVDAIFGTGVDLDRQVDDQVIDRSLYAQRRGLALPHISFSCADEQSLSELY